MSTATGFFGSAAPSAPPFPVEAFPVGAENSVRVDGFLPRQGMSSLQFIDRTKELLSKRRGFFVFNTPPTLEGGQGNRAAPLGQRALNVNNGLQFFGVPHFHHHTSSRRREDEEGRPNYGVMILAGVVTAIYAFVWGRQSRFISDENIYLAECTQFLEQNQVLTEQLREVIDSRLAVHEKNISDARFHRNVAIAAIAASCLAFVGAALSLPPLIAAGSLIALGVTLYGMASWGMSSISEDTLCSRYERLQRAIRNFELI